MSRTATPQGPGGDFATSRRGGLTGEEIREIEAHRAKDRPTPWAALARRYGRCEADIRALFVTPEKSSTPAARITAEDQSGRKNFPWVDAQVAYLIAHYREDGPEGVARVLGCSKEIAKGKAHRLGITQARGWNNALRAKAA